MFALINVSVTHPGMGSSSFQYEFKDRVQCENAIKVMKNRFENYNVHLTAYCQEVRK